ncbi:MULTISPECIES: type 4a pilus biogenesis protein PilO [Candidatus Ichthyocystis]|uniref:Putative type 4 fimbrial protein PilO n=1 Tax=Candidatus Ichthyocystis hellenicum TaxID=1561003 RepID=A0A0S4M0T2_9BURK|nr:MULTISPECIES: type 4a pilus biogenesis protein PilO [Ichthyocystis]CUT17342.1 putative type 4 fimbrial protein PilO [Candidatus Ichthyocystis hellenicum]
MDLSNLSADIMSMGNDPIKWPKYIRISCIALLFVLVLVLNYIFFASAALNKFSALKIEERNLKKEYVGKLTEVANLPVYQQYFEYLSDSFGQLIDKLPKESQINLLLKNINRIGVANNMVFYSFLPGKEEKKDLYIEEPVSVEMVGSYNDFGEFAYQVAMLDTVVVLDNLTISTPSSVGKGGARGERSIKPGDLLFSFVARIYKAVEVNDKNDSGSNPRGGKIN